MKPRESSEEVRDGTNIPWRRDGENAVRLGDLLHNYIGDPTFSSFNFGDSNCMGIKSPPLDERHNGIDYWTVNLILEGTY